MAPTAVRRPMRRSPPRVKTVGGIRRTHARRSILANSNQVEVLEKVRKILNKPAGYLPTDQEASDDDKSSSRLRVAVRVRPLSAHETRVNSREVVSVAGPNMLIFDPPVDQQEFFFHNKKQRDVTAKKYKNQKFAFDFVYDPAITTGKIYMDVINPLLSTLMTGINCSVFAYGATGSGKTYTMLGTPNNPGLTYLAMNDLYSRLEDAREQFDFQIVVSYFEVYNEQVRDLLNYTGEQLQVREIGGGIDIGNLSYHHPRDVTHIMEMLTDGNSHRSQHPTDHNAESSRSHALLQVHIRLRERHASMATTSRSAKLVMVDLAGSEKGAATGFNGMRFREGSSINKSLLALGNCISALASGKKFIQFRDSKLTRILKDSLGGNCKTVMVANVSPAETLYDDTLNTLRYAEKAKKISCVTKKNLMTVQSCLTQYTRVVDEMAVKIETLESDLREREESLQAKLTELAEVKEELAKRDQRIEELTQAAIQRTVSSPVDEKQGNNQLGAGDGKMLPSILNIESEPVRKFVQEVEMDTKKKKQIREEIENYTYHFALTNKRLTRCQEMFKSTGDVRFEKAANRAHKKMKSLLKKLKSALIKAMDLLFAGRSTHPGPIFRYRTTFSGMFKTHIKTPPKKEKVVRMSSNIVLDYIMRKAKAGDLETENDLLKSQSASLMKRYDQEAELLKNAVNLTNKLHNIVKHYEHDTPTLNEQYDNFTSTYCGTSVKFADDSIDDDNDDKPTEGNNQEQPVEDQAEAESTFSFLTRTVKNIPKTWKTTEELFQKELEELQKLTEEKLQEFMMQEDKIEREKGSSQTEDPHQDQVSISEEKDGDCDSLMSRLPEPEAYNSPLSDIPEGDPHATFCNPALPEDMICNENQPATAMEPSFLTLSQCIDDLDNIYSAASASSPLHEKTYSGDLKPIEIASKSFEIPSVVDDCFTAPTATAPYSSASLPMMSTSQQINRIGTDETSAIGGPSSNFNMTTTLSRFDGTFTMDTHGEFLENESPVEIGLTLQSLVNPTTSKIGFDKQIEDEGTGQPKAKYCKKTPYNPRKARSPKIAKAIMRKDEGKGSQSASVSAPSYLRIPMKTGASSSKLHLKKSPSSISITKIPSPVSSGAMGNIQSRMVPARQPQVEKPDAKKSSHVVSDGLDNMES